MKIDHEFMNPKWFQSAFNSCLIADEEKLVFLIISCCTDENGQGAASANFIKHKTKITSDKMEMAIDTLKSLQLIENHTANTYKLVIRGV